MPSAPPDAAVARFRAHLIALAGDAGPFGVAVSGGPDSLALLLLCANAFPDRTFAATVDHGLREAGAREAGMVALLCQSMGVPHAVLTPQTPLEGNIQGWARRERYAALEGWAADRTLSAILTGHHADDQLETMIMRLNRGSGVAGLAGIRGRQGRIVRPLLGWRRAELIALVQEAGLDAVDDPSNSDVRFDRARLRAALDCAPWLDRHAAARSAAALADAETALQWAAHEAAATRLTILEDTAMLDAAGLPGELMRRLVIAAIVAVCPEARPRGEDITRLVRELMMGGVATLAGVRCQGGRVWRFTAAPPHRAASPAP